MTDNNLRISFDYRYPDEAALIAYSTFEGGYLGGEPTISLRKVITGDEAVELYSKLAGKTVEYVKKKAGYIDDESKFEPPKAEPDGYTKKLFGMPCKGEEIMSEKSCKLCDLYGICGARTAGCVKDPDEGCPFYRYFKKIFQPTTKNNLGVDCISRDSAIKALDYDIKSFEFKPGVSEHMDDIAKLLNTIYEIQVNNIKALSSVTSQEPKWIPMVRREPTDEEKAEYLAQNGEELCYMLENEMPLNGQEVLVSIGELVSEDVFDEDFYNFENNDIENVDAWMPKPKPYEPQESEDKE